MENQEEIKPGNKFFKSWNFWKQVLAVVVGALAGYLYYNFVGCSSGQCAITGNPYMSAIWGGLFALFLVNSPCSSGKC